MLDLFAVLVIGFLGSLHCIGMCGPLVLAYSLHIHGHGNSGMTVGPSLLKRGILHHMAFHTGRILTYGFLGMLAGGIIQLTTDFSRFFFDLRGSMTLLGGTFMIFAGLVLLRVVPFPFSLTNTLMGPESLFGRWLPTLFRSQKVVSKTALGLATGFLPCVLSWSMIIKAATTENPLTGFITMAIFGLGTVPVLFFTGLSASLLSMKIRILGERIAALSVSLMGLILIFKGVRAFA